jgi:ADP-heptose:LPS heptosyltransferase
VKRFQGQRLSGDVRVAVIANDALGNYVVATPLLQAVRRKFNPKRLDFYSGHRTEELWSVDPNIDAGFRIFGGSPRKTTITALERGAYDLVINLESSHWARSFAAVLSDENTYVVGACLSPNGRDELPFGSDLIGRLAEDPDWTSAEMLTRYPMLCSSFIGEIFCRLVYIEGPVPAYSVPTAPPSIDIPPLLIGASASLVEKLWPTERWIETLSELSKMGLRAGLLGARPSAQRQYWRGDETEQLLVDRGLVDDLRGRLTLPEVVGSLDAARAVLTLDNGIMHLGAATQTPVVGLFRHGFHRLWAPPSRNVTVIAPPEGSSVADISVEEVLKEARNAF